VEAGRMTGASTGARAAIGSSPSTTWARPPAPTA